MLFEERPFEFNEAPWYHVLKNENNNGKTFGGKALLGASVAALRIALQCEKNLWRCDALQ